MHNYFKNSLRQNTNNVSGLKKTVMFKYLFHFSLAHAKEASANRQVLPLLFECFQTSFILLCIFFFKAHYIAELTSAAKSLLGKLLSAFLSEIHYHDFFNYLQFKAKIDLK